MEQRSPEWFAARAGMFTASRVGDLMSTLKSGQPGASYHNMVAALVVERITGECVETYTNAAMERGVALEDEAINAYAFKTMADVQRVGLVISEENEKWRASPDGLIGEQGLLEVKCPMAMAKHMDALMKGAHVTEYRWQVQHQMLVTGRAWCDVVSYDPRWPAHLQVAVERVEANLNDFDAIKARLAQADDEIMKSVETLTYLREAAE